MRRYIKGLSLDQNGSKNIKVIQYADDATLFLKPAQEMREAISSSEEFGKVAGTKLKLTKCEGLYIWIGSSKNGQNACICVIQSGQLNLLGTWEYILDMTLKHALI